MLLSSSKLVAHQSRINGNTVYVRTSLICDYEAEDNVLRRLISLGARFERAECVQIGKLSKIIYWKANHKTA